MTLYEKIEKAIEAPLSHEGYGVVRILISGDHYKTIQFMIERKDGENVDMNDCTKASRYISSLLDVEDLIPFRYTLEVSSAGMDRPLIKKEDYVRFKGKQIKASLTEAIGNQKKFIGILKEADDEKITLFVNSDKEETITFDIPYHQIQNAKLYIDFGNFTAKGKPGGKSKNKA